jgi:hypothetical protein
MKASSNHYFKNYVSRFYSINDLRPHLFWVLLQCFCVVFVLFHHMLNHSFTLLLLCLPFPFCTIVIVPSFHTSQCYYYAFLCILNVVSVPYFCVTLLLLCHPFVIFLPFKYMLLCASSMPLFHVACHCYVWALCVCKGFKYVFIKSTHAYLHKCITWPK